MTNNNRQQSLEAARSAVHFLKLYIQTEIVDARIRAEIGCLLDEFERMDAKEQTQIKAGAKGKEFGIRGGRPRKATTKKRGRK